MTFHYEPIKYLPNNGSKDLKVLVDQMIDSLTTEDLHSALGGSKEEVEAELEKHLKRLKELEFTEIKIEQARHRLLDLCPQNLFGEKASFEEPNRKVKEKVGSEPKETEKESGSGGEDEGEGEGAPTV